MKSDRNKFKFRNTFYSNLCLILADVAHSHMRRENITLVELCERMNNLGYNTKLRSVYSAMYGYNYAANNFVFWAYLFESINLQLDVHTFAQLLQESQAFNAEFKAKKQAKILENKRNKQK